jgi:hypothetical protein
MRTCLHLLGRSGEIMRTCVHLLGQR